MLFAAGWKMGLRRVQLIARQWKPQPTGGLTGHSATQRQRLPQPGMLPGCWWPLPSGRLMKNCSAPDATSRFAADGQIRLIDPAPPS